MATRNYRQFTGQLNYMEKKKEEILLYEIAMLYSINDNFNFCHHAFTDLSFQSALKFHISCFKPKWGHCSVTSNFWSFWPFLEFWTFFLIYRIMIIFLEFWSQNYPITSEEKKSTSLIWSESCDVTFMEILYSVESTRLDSTRFYDTKRTISF